MKRFLLVTCLLLLVTVTPAYATEDIGQSRIAPNSPIYFLKTIRESIELKFANSPKAKMEKNLVFATRRLREVKSLIGSASEDLIEPALERYWYNLQYVDNVGDSNLAAKVKTELSIHLQTLISIYPSITNTRAKMAVRAAVNRIVGRADVDNSVKIPACSFIASEASSSALGAVEKSILLDRAQKCFQSTHLK